MNNLLMKKLKNMKILWNNENKKIDKKIQVLQTIFKKIKLNIKNLNKYLIIMKEKMSYYKKFFQKWKDFKVYYLKIHKNYNRLI